MKLSKKIISVLLSTSYMFTSIAFADGPKGTPKTETKKLEPVYLANVAQYIPMAEKIKLEQVNKNCADSLNIGFADEFLNVYILLNILPTDKRGKPILSLHSDFTVAERAFKNSIKYYSFKTETKIEAIPEEWRDLCFITKNGILTGIIFPRSYALTTQGLKKLVQEYGDLNEENKTEKAKKDFIRTKIFNNTKFTTSTENIEKLKKQLEGGLLLKLQKLENRLQKNISFDKQYSQLFKVLPIYFSNDIPQLIDSVRNATTVTPSVLGVDTYALTAYELLTDSMLSGNTEIRQMFWDKLPKKYQQAKLHVTALWRAGLLKNNEVTTYYNEIESLKSASQFAYSQNSLHDLRACLTSLDNLLCKYNVERIKLGPTKTEFEVFARFLRKQNVSLRDCDAKFLYLFFCTPIDIINKTSAITYYPVACKLCDVKKIIDDFMSEEIDAITQLDFAEEDIECGDILIQYYRESNKKWLTEMFANSRKIRRAFAHIDFMFKQPTDHKINLNALQIVVYIMYKLGCEPEIIQNMQTALLATYVPNNDEDIDKIKHIFRTAGRGKPENLDEDLGTIEYTLSRIPIPEEKSPRNNFGTALVGVAGLSALGALVYNGIKYTNRSSNISKPTNNKNINKKIAKNIS